MRRLRAPYRLLPGADSMLFTEGRPDEQSSGHYDYRARFYEAIVGTWLTRDPAGFVNCTVVSGRGQSRAYWCPLAQ
ncbi:MAG: hypothetical protein AB7K09_23800 [Planctomycetota bacterium]